MISGEVGISDSVSSSFTIEQEAINSTSRQKETNLLGSNNLASNSRKNKGDSSSRTQVSHKMMALKGQDWLLPSPSLSHHIIVVL